MDALVNGGPRNRVQTASAFAVLTLAWVLLFDFYGGRDQISFDLLPDVFAYALAIVAGKRLHDTHRDAPRFTQFAIVLLLLSILDVLRGLGATHFDLTSTPFLLGFFVIDTAHAALDIALLWLFTYMVIDIGRDIGMTRITGRATNRRNLFIAYVAIGWALPFISALLLPRDLALLFHSLLGAFATAGVALLAHEIRRHLDAAPNDGERRAE